MHECYIRSQSPSVKHVTACVFKAIEWDIYVMSIVLHMSMHGMTPAYQCNETILKYEIVGTNTRFGNDNHAYVQLWSSKTLSYTHRSYVMEYAT